MFPALGFSGMLCPWSILCLTSPRLPSSASSYVLGLLLPRLQHRVFWLSKQLQTWMPQWNFWIYLLAVPCYSLGDLGQMIYALLHPSFFMCQTGIDKSLVQWAAKSTHNTIVCVLGWAQSPTLLSTTKSSPHTTFLSIVHESYPAALESSMHCLSSCDCSSLKAGNTPWSFQYHSTFMM